MRACYKSVTASRDDLPGAPPLKERPSPRFVVTSVNGKRFEKPVIFSGFSRAWEGAEEIPQRAGPVWEVRGCETGGFRGTPREVRDDASKGPNRPPAMQHVDQDYEFKFYTNYIYSSSRRV
jgi:hypothetical protein